MCLISDMQLETYLAERQIGLGEFATRIGVTHEAVRQYVRKGRVPRPEVMDRIIEATDGAVRPNDFSPMARKFA